MKARLKRGISLAHRLCPPWLKSYLPDVPRSSKPSRSSLLLRWRSSFWQYSRLGSKEIAVLEACLIGLVSGLAAVLLKQSVGVLGTFRVRQVELGWVWLPLIGALGGFLAGWLSQNFAPETTGSGIPQVKAALSRVPLALNLRVATVKLLSTLLVMGSGMSLGRQGPTVQIGAALAGEMRRWVPTSPNYRRQMIAAGAAAGLAAGFNAPLAGVMFVIEELLQDLSSLTLGTAIIASFLGAMVSRQLGGHGLISISSLKAQEGSLGIEDLPFLLLIGALAGGLGGLFCQGIISSRALYDRFIPLALPYRVAMAGAISGLVIAMLPPAFRNNAGLQEYLVSGEVLWYVVLLAFLSKFCLTLVATGSGASGGLFAPSLILGSSLGYLVPLCAIGIQKLPYFPDALLIPISSPSIYALAGMGAFFSAVAKTPMTAILIIFEMTGDFNLVLPLMLSSIIAYSVGNKIFRGSLYDRLLKLQGLEIHASHQTLAPWEQITASQVMQTQVQTLSPYLTLEETLKIFLQSAHRGFPVVTNGELVGILSQSDLSRYSHHADLQQVVESVMTRSLITVQPQDTLNHVLHLLHLHDIGRLPVTDGRRLVGIITLSDIIRVEAQQLEVRDGTLGNAHTNPSYVVYQTHGPATGRGRLLVPLSNPKTAPTLLQLAAAIARDRDYELECLQIITIPKNQSPYTAKVDTDRARKLLHKARDLGEDWGISVHTQIRVTHAIAPAILETIRDRRIDLMFMGWKGKSNSPDRLFGDAMDTLIRQAPCTVVLVKLADRLQQSPTHYPSLLARLHFNRWLIPVGSGPNTQETLQLLPGLIAVGSTPEIKLCQITNPSYPDLGRQDQPVLETIAQQLRQKIQCPIEAVQLSSHSIAQAIVDLSHGNHEHLTLERKQNWGGSLDSHHDRCDVIVIGASRDHFLQHLQQIAQGKVGPSVAEEVALRSQCTVILVRTP
jgi:chloride channel protein, CIC family